MATRLHVVEQSFLNTIKENNLIQANDKIVVGVSGGPDSTTLLSCLNKYKERLKCEIVVAHVNHLIREDSTEDEQYVENLCKEMRIKHFVKRVKVEELAKEKKRSTEEMGRMIRYEFFDLVAQDEKANKIAIAHNMNDNAETVLLNLIRGSGLAGLEGIQPMQYNKYIRPLINCHRKDIENYCEKNKLNPRIDYTNKENIYKRNIIRNNLIPSLKELNPNIVQTLSRTSEIIAENNKFLNVETIKKYNKIAQMEDKKVKFNLKEFNEISIFMRKNIVLMAITSLIGDTKNIEKSNIDDVIRLAQNNIGNKYMYLNKKTKAEIRKGRLVISEE